MNFRRMNEAKKEAVKNAIYWLIQNELIKYQVKYERTITEEEKNFYGHGIYGKEIYCARLTDQNIFTSKKIYDIIAPMLVTYGTSPDNGISLNPTRKKYRYYIFIKDLKSKIKEIENITTTHEPSFWGLCGVITKENVPKDAMESFKDGNKIYIKLESHSNDNRSNHYRWHNY